MHFQTFEKFAPITNPSLDEAPVIGIQAERPRKSSAPSPSRPAAAQRQQFLPLQKSSPTASLEALLVFKFPPPGVGQRQQLGAADKALGLEEPPRQRTLDQVSAVERQESPSA